MAGRIGSISVSAFVNATEDRNKVIECVTNVIGEIDEKMISSAMAEGSFGNPKEILNVELTRNKEVQRCFCRISSSDYYIASFVPPYERLDDHLVYHIRLGKDSCFLGAPTLWKKGETIVIRIRVHTYPSSREQAVELLRPASGETGKDIIH